MSTEFWIQMIAYGVSLGTFGGVVLTRLNNLEKKMDKHNSLVERLTRCEGRVESAHNRIDELREER